MTSRPGRDGEHDAMVCADVLGSFGVSVTDVRAQTGTPGASLETALASALEAAGHPAEFLRDVVVASDRGLDAPARYWSHAPAAHLADVFDAIDWEFSMRDAHGRPVSADGESPGPYTLSVTDANDITREAPFEYPDTPLGDYNLPALVDAVNVRLLYGLGCEFVQLSDGTDRWRFALVETEERARLDESYGPRVEVFDRPLLAKYQPGAYVPDDGEDVPLPEWVTSTEGSSLAERAPDRATGVADLDDPVEADPDAVLEGEDGVVAGEPEGDDGTADIIDFVGDDSPRTESVDTVDVVEDGDPVWEGGDGEETDDDGGVSTWRDDEVEGGEAEGGAADREDADDDQAGPVDATPFWDEDDWVLDPGGDDERTADAADGDGDDHDGVDDVGWSDGFVLDSGVDEPSGEPGDASVSAGERAVTATVDTATVDGQRSDEAVDTATGSSSPGESDDTGTDGFELRGGGPAVSRADDDALDDVFDELEADAATESVGDPADEGRDDDDAFDVGGLAGGGANRKAARIEDDDFGVDVESTEDDRLAAYGAAIHVGGGISVRGLLDDDEFVPEFPAAERNEVRIEFEESFDPATPSPAERRETDDGFVWVNEGALAENRQ
ncbi:hypothetical protein [Haloarchaeobius iranensis]|uniref:Uncharacterized protein n=1 Tax=Haloarchaeobius iranensis TaxID=996166 RepID=A0A1G9SE40_9EURY|nr:hypothetical protein [Haloarchaeobius iranensis]SDM33743.1 hypothetical protein SAMN05192554_101125 [Haloarchaeobius iranensis]